MVGAARVGHRQFGLAGGEYGSERVAREIEEGGRRRERRFTVWHRRCAVRGDRAGGDREKGGADPVAPVLVAHALEGQRGGRHQFVRQCPVADNSLVGAHCDRPAPGRIWAGGRPDPMLIHQIGKQALHRLLDREIVIIAPLALAFLQRPL